MNLSNMRNLLKTAITKNEIRDIVNSDYEYRRYVVKDYLKKTRKKRQAQFGAGAGIGGSAVAYGLAKKAPKKIKIPAIIGAGTISSLGASKLTAKQFDKKYKDMIEATRDASKKKAIDSITKRVRQYRGDKLGI